MSASLCSLDKVKELVDVDGGYSNFDGPLWNFMISATSLIENATNLKFERQESVEYFDTRKNYTQDLDISNVYSDRATKINTKTRKFRLSGAPLTSDSTFDVRLDYSREFGEASLLVQDRDYIVELEKGTILILINTQDADRSLKVTYTSGYQPQYNKASKEYHKEVNDTLEVNSNMTMNGGLASLFDNDTGTDAQDSARVAGSSGSVWQVFEQGQVIGYCKWHTPLDVGVHGENVTETTLTLEASVLGDFSDTEVIGTRTVRGIAPSETHKVNSTSVKQYKAVRVTANNDVAVDTYCSEIEFALMDKTKPYLSGVPSDLQNAAGLLAKFLFLKNRGNGVGVVRTGDKSSPVYHNSNAMPSEIVQMISPYKRWLRGKA